MLFQGTVRLYEGGGRLTFHITDVSTEFSLGQIEARRRQVLARLQREGLCDLNGHISFADLPLRIGVISSRSARGLDDFLQVLKDSGYAFHVFHHDVPVQGPDMERAVCMALSLFASQQTRLQLDVLCLVRGGGSATDLGWWNSYTIAAAIARMPVPVLTGIGHGLDRVAVDEVVHQRLATPTAAAQFLVEKIQTAKVALGATRQGICDAAMSVMERHRTAIATSQNFLADLVRAALSANKYVLRSTKTAISRGAPEAISKQTGRITECVQSLFQEAPAALSLARHSLEAVIQGLHEAALLRLVRDFRELKGLRTAIPAHATLALTLSRRLVRGFDHSIAHTALQRLRAEDRHFRQTRESLPGLCARAFLQERQRLNQYKQLIEAFDPAHVLKRGYSVTLDETGKAIKDAAALQPGARIVTLLSRGTLHSTVTESSSNNEGGAT